MEQKNFDQQESLENNVSKKEKGYGFFSEVIKFVIVALLVVLPIRIFVAEPFVVSGASMEPTFHSGNYLIIDKVSYRFNKPERGDIIVLKSPLDKSKFLIKRIIGLPNETIKIVSGDIYVSLNPDEEGKRVEELYVVNKTNDDFLITLEEEEYFVMGDNRPVSLDSRSWGVLERNLIKGKPLLRLLPITKVEVYPGEQS